VSAPTLQLDVEGPAAPPRSNGELVFAEPWEGRAFGLTMALVHGGVLDYETFRTALIERIQAWESSAPAGERFRYYRCWLAALEQVLETAGLISESAVIERSVQFAARPAGHDHRHDDGHPHAHDHPH
jgi:nitrile hydratase accessory protein